MVPTDTLAEHGEVGEAAAAGVVQALWADFVTGDLLLLAGAGVLLARGTGLRAGDREAGTVTR